jgi:predicted acetyltransferase
MCDIVLVEPAKEYEKAAMEYKQDYCDYGEYISFNNYDEWLGYVIYMENNADEPTKTYFMIRKNDNKVIGTAFLRYRMTEDNANLYGHVGYGICPSERKKGYATQQLALIIEKAKDFKMQDVKIACDKINIASAKVAINNGGVLIREFFNEKSQEDTQIYLIDLAV